MSPRTLLLGFSEHHIRLLANCAARVTSASLPQMSRPRNIFVAGIAGLEIALPPS
jgi:hypothetical protein